MNTWHVSLYRIYIFIPLEFPQGNDISFVLQTEKFMNIFFDFPFDAFCKIFKVVHQRKRMSVFDTPRLKL